MVGVNIFVTNTIVGIEENKSNTIQSRVIPDTMTIVKATAFYLKPKCLTDYATQVLVSGRLVAFNPGSGHAKD